MSAYIVAQKYVPKLAVRGLYSHWPFATQGGGARA